ncbi:MAG TPA: TRAP transporter substrate-binding protein DctP [Candidatus Limnocylindrales bacterium]|nr:TRAP transporter substrate-binding protein DctP [Candidatus Limnocylindrales bacterium]
MNQRSRAVLLTIVALMLAACSSGPAATTSAPSPSAATTPGPSATGGEPTASAGEPTATPGPTLPPRQEGVLTLAHSYVDEHPAVRCGAQVIADELAAADVGLTIELYGGSQLGPDADRILSVQAGDIDIDIQGASALAAIYEPISAVDGAFVFDDSQHMYDYLSGDASDALKQGFYDATGVTILGGWNTGARQFTANVPIRTPEDLEGLRMRFPGSPTFLLNAEAMGAEAVAVPFEELFLALQQGTVDGQENPLVNIQTNNLTEVQDVVSMSSHQLSSNLVVVGPFWDELDEAQQTALSDAVAEAMIQEPECVTEIETEILDEWRANETIEIVEDVDREAFRAKAEPFLRENFTPEQIEVLDGIRSLVQ